MELVVIITSLIVYQLVGLILCTKEEFENPFSTIFFVVFYPIILTYRFIKGLFGN